MTFSIAQLGRAQYIQRRCSVVKTLPVKTDMNFLACDLIIKMEGRFTSESMTSGPSETSK